MRSRYICFVAAVVLLCSHASAQWVHTNGPCGAPNSSIAVSGANIFAGPFFSSNRGATWVTGIMPFDGFSEMIQVGQYLFAGTGAGVFLSTNNGANWTQSALGNTRITALAAAGTNLFAGTDDGVILSTNNGTNWSAVNSGLPRATVRALAVSGASILACLDPGGVFRSTDNGMSWAVISSLHWATAFAVSGLNTFACDNGLYISSDNGASWTSRYAGFASHVTCLAVIGTNLFAATAFDGVFLSTDNGTSWREVNTGLMCTDVQSLAVQGTDLYAATLNGVFLSTNNGSSWIDISDGMTSRIISLEAWRTSVFAGNLWGGVYRLRSDEASWTRLNLTLHIFRSVKCFATLGSNLFAGVDMAFGKGLGVFRSTDEGSTWTEVNTGLTDFSIKALTVASTDLFAGTEGGVFLSTDSGANWNAVNNGLTDLWIGSLGVSGTTLFAATLNGGVFVSSNNGTNWTSASTPFRDFVKMVQVGMNLFAGTSSGIFLSTDNGTTWTAVNSGLTNTTINSLAASGTSLFAWTDDGVFLSTNNGSSWTTVSQNLPEYIPTKSVPNCLVVCGQNLFAGTENGVWRRALSEVITSVGRHSNDVPTDFRLEQNYPNPFNPLTVVSFQLPVASDVRLVVRDVLGREVATLVDERRTAGAYQVTFDGTGLSSGVYVCQMMAGPHRQAFKMVLTK